MKLGIETCHATPPPVLNGARLGLLANQASLDQRFRYSHRSLAEQFPGQLRAIFTPQHGLFGEQQANMIESPHGWEPRLNVPVYSLYHESRRPTPEMLADLDFLLVDLQDVGTRVYTFIWTITHCLEACAERGIPVIVLDRPNPLGGEVAEGPLLQPDFRTFVGRAEIPMRHGMTIGELTLYLNAVMELEADVMVWHLQDWRRSMLWDDTGLPWIAPSPNLPRMAGGVQLYPGGVLLEGTNLSEGRGTTTPFELVGAPFIDGERLIEALEGEGMRLPGVTLRPVRFLPTFDKWQGQSCGGVYFHVTDPRKLRSYRLMIAILSAVSRLWPDDFQWLPPPYEYETIKPPIDILTGSSKLRERLEDRNPLSRDELADLTAAPAIWQETLLGWSLYG